MSDKNYAPVCGVYCGGCHLLGKECAGCGYVDGSPFWVSSMELTVCPLYDCCHNQMQLEHCGMCEGFPCDLFAGLRDPSMTDEQHEASLSSRRGALARRREIGTEQWLLEVSGS